MLLFSSKENQKIETLPIVRLTVDKDKENWLLAKVDVLTEPLKGASSRAYGNVYIVFKNAISMIMAVFTCSNRLLIKLVISLFLFHRKTQDQLAFLILLLFQVILEQCSGKCISCSRCVIYC